MPTHLVFSLAASVFGVFGVLAWRIRETRTPVTMRKIVAPPLGMSTGLCMFVVPAFRLPILWAVAAIIAGATLLAYPLLRTSRLHLDPASGSVSIQRSPAFFFVFGALALLRLGAHAWIGSFLSLPQTAGLFFLLAYGMILRWRIDMVREFKGLTAA